MTKVKKVVNLLPYTKRDAKPGSFISVVSMEQQISSLA